MENLEFVLKDLQKTPLSVKQYKDSNQLVKNIVSDLVLGKTPSTIKSKIANEDGHSLSDETISSLVDSIYSAMKKLSTKRLTAEEVLTAETIAINARARGSANVSEIIKRIKQEICVLGKDDELKQIVENVLSGSEIIIDLPPMLISQLESSYNRLLDKERNSEFLIAVVDKNIDIEKPVLFYHKNRIAGIGVISEIVEEHTSQNIVKIHPTILKTRTGIYTAGLKYVQVVARDTPLISIPPQIAEKIKKELGGKVESFIVGVFKSVGRPVISFDGPSFATMSKEKLLDDLEGRLRIIGLPGTGKTLFANQLLRQIAQKTDLPIIAISPFTPNLANFGKKPKIVENSEWDPYGIAKMSTQKFGESDLRHYKILTFGENDLLPDIGKLNIRTIADILEAVTQSVSVKATILSKSVGKGPAEILRRAARKELLRETDGFNATQIAIAQRLANVLLHWGGTKAKKVNLAEELDVRNGEAKYIGVYIKDGPFVSELSYIIMAEIYNNNQPVIDPKTEGFVLFVDELPALVNRKGAVLDGADVGRMFSQLVTQSRNKGILLGGILQYESNGTKNLFPGKAEQYATYYTSRYGHSRVIKIEGQEFMIIPITFGD